MVELCGVNLVMNIARTDHLGFGFPNIHVY